MVTIQMNTGIYDCLIIETFWKQFSYLQDRIAGEMSQGLLLTAADLPHNLFDQQTSPGQLTAQQFIQ